MDIDDDRKEQYRRLFAALPYLLWNERPMPKEVGDLHEVIHLVNDLVIALPMIHNVFMTGYYEGNTHGHIQGVQAEKIRQWEENRKALRATCKHQFAVESDDDFNTVLVCTICDYVASPEGEQFKGLPAYEPTPVSEM